jgi:uncharacterized phage protein (TIGR02218 family)
LYQAGCINTLFDTSCGLNAAAFATSGTVAMASAASGFSTTLAQATGYFDLGVVTFTNGTNSGLSRTVKAYAKGAPGTVSLTSPFPVVPAPGDAFTITAGCDKQQSTCSGKFGNLINFRGFPYVPENSTAV